MGCWHGRHGCGPWYGPPDGPDRYGYADWWEEAPPLLRRRYRRADAGEVADEMEARLDDLRNEVRRMEQELAGLRSQKGSTAEER